LLLLLKLKLIVLELKTFLLIEIFYSFDDRHVLYFFCCCKNGEILKYKYIYIYMKILSIRFKMRLQVTFFEKKK
jgi:hypothetical protein